jgi:hypothetical protein
MKGDFTRVTFDAKKHYTRVLMQQGRVQLDADWNEQASILLHYLQSLAVDLIGPHAGPYGEELGFGISPSDDGFTIGPGRYYVNGILCENELIWDEENYQLVPVTYYSQPEYLNPPSLPDEPPYLIYLDVWERHLTHFQEPELREAALNGRDTTTRAKIVWQVKVERGVASCDDWSDLVENWQSTNRGMLRAGTKEFEVDEETEPCTISPESKYRGAENQLYRVEIHTGGEEESATFKWSRENGSVEFPILSLKDEIALAHLGRDDRSSLREGDWVEIVDDEMTLHGETLPLFLVKSVDRDRLVVELEVSEYVDLPDYDETSASHPFLRRWDHNQLDPTLGYPEMADDGALMIEEDKWLLLEDGIQICFEPANSDESADSDKSHSYRSGDYWLIPARTTTGDVIWPGSMSAPESRPPHGVNHSYAPIAIAILNEDDETDVIDCRREIKRLWNSLSAEADSETDSEAE